MTKSALMPVCFLLLAGTAQAAVKSVGATGFEVSETVTIQAPADRVYAALGKINRWWSSAHTGSGSAGNLHIDIKIGGCFCEKAKDGLERLHMTVVDVEPGKLVRLRGALGPLQGEGVEGALTWIIEPSATGVTLTQDYIVGGYFRSGGAYWATPVDGVLHEQITRLKAFVETNAPDTVTNP